MTTKPNPPINPTNPNDPNPLPPKNPPPQPATAPKGDDGEIKRYQDAVDPLDLNLEGRN